MLTRELKSIKASFMKVFISIIDKILLCGSRRVQRSSFQMGPRNLQAQIAMEETLPIQTGDFVFPLDCMLYYWIFKKIVTLNCKVIQDFVSGKHIFNICPFISIRFRLPIPPTPDIYLPPTSLSIRRTPYIFIYVCVFHHDLQYCCS